MPQYYSLEKAAEVVGIYPADLNRMREKGEIRAFRDSGDWKFIKEEIDQLALKIRAERTTRVEPDADESEDVLLSEVELGPSDASSSGTVIGADEQRPEDSDIKLAGSDIGISSDDAPLGKDDSGFEELDLTIDDDLSLEDSQISLSDDEPIVKDGSTGSAIELGAGLDDDDLVLGGSGSSGSSGSGSDISIGQDSGISLVDPDDSGLSLEDPLELAEDDESLALGEDDVLSLSEDADTEAPTELKSDDDFLLEPLEELGEEEEAESGSQVIALDESIGDEAATLGAGAMLDEEPVSVEPGAGAPFGVRQPSAGEAPLTPGAAALPEAPFGTLAMVMLTACTVVLLLSGVIAYDLLRNMWSWNGPYEVNSAIMDMVLGLFG